MRIVLGTGSEVHLGFVQAVGHKHLLSGNMDWDITRRKVLRAFCSAWLKCSRSSPEWANVGNACHFCLSGGCSAKLQIFLTVFCGVFFFMMQFLDHCRGTK